MLWRWQYLRSEGSLRLPDKRQLSQRLLSPLCCAGMPSMQGLHLFQSARMVAHSLLVLTPQS